MYFLITFFGKANDDRMLPVLIIPAVIISIVCAVLYIARQREKIRTQKLTTIFKELDYPFQADVDPVRLEQLSEFPLMNIGHSKRLKNVISVEGPTADIAMFDYRYVTGYGKHRKVRQQTVMSVESTSLVLPVFNLRPEGFWSKVGAAFGGQDIDFVEYPDFSEKYVLKGESEEEVRTYMDTMLLDFFTAQDKICCEVRDGTILYYHRYTRVAPDMEELQNFMVEGMGVFEELLARQSRPGGQSA
ncbi:MAG: hypothetical protein NZ807_02700 [Dehalococcoidia bacterium]|nr:hypothetical protein [Dehalococcoidia bacterium]